MILMKTYDVMCLWQNLRLDIIRELLAIVSNLDVVELEQNVDII